MDTGFERIVLALFAAAAAGLGWGAVRLKRQLGQSERERRHATDELNRRLSELLSLRELFHVLSGSLQVDRIAERVAHYAMRFLNAEGALVALAAHGGSEGAGADVIDGHGGGRGRGAALKGARGPLHVAAAEGTLAVLHGQTIGAEDPGLVARSADGESSEPLHGLEGKPTQLVAGLEVACATAVPLRVHGALVGTLVVTDPRYGRLDGDDMQLLSTLATQAAIVIANARFFETVRHAKEQWETAFDALREGIAVVDEQGRVRRANHSLAAMLGAAVPAVIGLDLGAALLGDPRPLFDLLAATRRGDVAQPLTVRSGQLERTLRLDAARIPSPADDQSVVVLVEDVTDQQALEAQLIQSEKLAAVGQLVSGVAHELNNPLTSIAGLSELLLEQRELGAKDRGHLRVIHEEADRASRIVRSLLTFARRGPGERAAVDLNDVIQRSLVLLAYDPKLGDITIEKDLTPVPEVLGDRNALQQVVLNLLTNAAQALTANPPGRARVIRVRTWFDDRVRMRIADTGPGIPDALLPHLFTPFFTTKEPGQGTGLGLSISHSIVEAHGGRVAVERSTDGSGREGAAFLVDLPPASPDAPRRSTPVTPLPVNRFSRA
ncbi:MAG TPA: ATP-binding protein [Gemmatimonadales bacterium]